MAVHCVATEHGGLISLTNTTTRELYDIVDILIFVVFLIFDIFSDCCLFFSCSESRNCQVVQHLLRI